MANHSLPLPLDDASPSDRYAVIMCGSRWWRHRGGIRAVLLELHAQHPDLYVIHGDQVSVVNGEKWGADYFVKTECIRLRIPQHPYPADWKANPRSAGPIRNKRMYDENPDVREVFGFIPAHLIDDPEQGKGTRGCLKIARQRHIPYTLLDDNAVVWERFGGAA